MTALFARRALLPYGWANDVRLEWSGSGTLTRVVVGGASDEAEHAELVLPGMPNLHSHAFQRALAGRTEHAGEDPDSFWTWRDLMYRFARVISPPQLEAIAAQLYVECLRHGYTSVCEFHYLHRDPAGAFYPRIAETAERTIAAARATGIGITMLPVLYSWAGFGEQPLAPEQQRFRTSADEVLRIVEALEPARDGQLEIGVAPHSLRAASLAQVARVVAAMPPGRPLHIHIAEQVGEVEQSLAFSGQRPVRWLMDHVDVDQRWCLVHATHLDDEEVAALAKSGAVAGLCPTTEANLGDGLFPLQRYLDHGGRIGIGSDSHVSQSPVEELRWLEYGQRLVQRRRNIAQTGETRQVGDVLWQQALVGGAQAAGRPVGALRVGERADVIVLDDAHPAVAGADTSELLGRFVFCGNDNLVKHVLVGGGWVVRDRAHVDGDAIAERYRRVLTELR
ncbi:MAG: formimidoylglutamate deiminase [Polyangia bacterium]